MLRTYTAFCTDVDGFNGTLWISPVKAETVGDAIDEAKIACADDWECDITTIHCLGIAEGNVNILEWEDLPV